MEKNIAQTARDAGTFTTLTAAIDRAGLASTLEGDGPFTVFAPMSASILGVTWRSRGCHIELPCSPGLDHRRGRSRAEHGVDHAWRVLLPAAI